MIYKSEKSDKMEEAGTPQQFHQLLWARENKVQYKHN